MEVKDKDRLTEGKERLSLKVPRTRIARAGWENLALKTGPVIKPRYYVLYYGLN